VTSTESPSAAAAGPVSDGHRQPANFRDLGGLSLAAGGLTRAGVLYRSDALYPGDAVPAAAPEWAPGTVIDLRSPGESAAGFPWPADCAAGKDRTGVAVAVLLLAAGVEPASVAADYTATAANMGRLLSRLQELGGGLPLNAGAHADLLAAPAEAITVVIDGLMGWPGGPQAWVADHGGPADGIRQWQNRLTA
jgi:hypothetical protein